MTGTPTSASRIALRQRFAELYGQAPPPTMRTAMLVAAIRWREQVIAHGDIEPAIARDLAIIAQEVRQSRRLVRSAASPTTPRVSTVPPPPLLPSSSQLRPGARLVRAYRGVTHVVEVTADGFLHQEQLYASLSAVAKAITGTHWNGLLFFGLRRRRTAGGSTSARRSREAASTGQAAHG